MSKKELTKKKKRLTVPIVKNAVRSGINYRSQIAKTFKVSKPYVTKFVGRMIKQGILKDEVIEGKGKVVKLLKVVEPVVNQSHIRDYMSSPKFFSDNAYVSYGILEYDKYFKPDGDWKPNENVVMKKYWLDDVYIQIANDKTIRFVFPKIKGQTPEDALTYLHKKSIRVRKEFLKKYPNFRFTLLPISESLGCLGTTKLKETIKHLNPHLPIKTDDWIIDKTPEEGSFEMKVKDDPLKTSEKLQKTVDTILDYPDRFEKMERLLEMVTVAFTKLVEFEMMKQKPDIQKYEGMVNKLPEVKEVLDMMNNKKKKKVTPSYVG